MHSRRRLASAIAALFLLAFVAWALVRWVDNDATPEDLQRSLEEHGREATQVPGIIEDPDGPTPSVTPPPPPPDQDNGENPASQVNWSGEFIAKSFTGL